MKVTLVEGDLINYIEVQTRYEVIQMTLGSAYALQQELKEALEAANENNKEN